MNTLLTLLSAGRLKQHYQEGHWRDETIFLLAKRHAVDSPDKFALRDRYRRITYGKLVASAENLAHSLQQAGVQSGQRVAVWLPSRIETAVAVLACSRNGYVCCPSLHRDHTVADICELIDRSRAAAFIGQQDYGADGRQVDIFAKIAEIGTIKYACRLSELVEKNENDAFAHETLEMPLAERGMPIGDPNLVVYLAFTSGTTGQPKGVMHSDNTLLANARSIAADWNLNGETVTYTLSPLSHNLGFGAMVMTFLIGGELVLHDLGRGESLLDRLIKTGATFLFGVPTHAIDLLTELKQRNLHELGNVKGFRISGAPVPKEVAADLLRHGVMPQSGYGMTEACSHHYTLPNDDPIRIIETSGRACSSYEIKIWSQEDQDVEVAAGTIGQIGGRGASLMLGYFDDQVATETSFNKSGWFMTGDLGCVDQLGYLRITGRKKDLIIRGGHNIYPARIENLVMQHEAIERTAVLPVPDARLGEKVCVAVMLRKGKALTPEALLSHLNAAGLSRYDMPEYFLQLDEIPLTASGKILKRTLVEDVREGRIQPLLVRWAPQ